MKNSRWLTVVGVALLAMSLGIAEEPPAAPAPSPQHEKLEMWIGSWTGKGEMKPGLFGPGGAVTWTEECEWFGGAKFNVVCRSKGDSPMGPMQGLGIIGYHTDKKVYTHYGVDTHGWAGLSEGTFADGKWVFDSTDSMEGKTFHGRFTMEWKSPTELTFSWAMSEDGENWMVMMDGNSTKK